MILLGLSWLLMVKPIILPSATMVEATNILQHPPAICYISYHLFYPRKSLRNLRKSRKIIMFSIYFWVKPPLFYSAALD